MKILYRSFKRYFAAVDSKFFYWSLHYWINLLLPLTIAHTFVSRPHKTKCMGPRRGSRAHKPAQVCTERRDIPPHSGRPHCGHDHPLGHPRPAAELGLCPRGPHRQIGSHTW